MATYRIKVYTGPVGVHEIAEKLTKGRQEEGAAMPYRVHGVSEGTEHVYFPILAEDSVGAILAAEELLRAVLGEYTDLARGLKAEKTRS